MNMLTDEEKLANRARLWALTDLGITIGIWDLLGQSSTALSPRIGEQILGLVEKQMGLVNFAGEEPEVILTKIAAIFVDGFGFAASSQVEKLSEKNIKVTLVNVIGSPEFAMLKQYGVEKLFSHPFLCVCLAALSRSGVRARGEAEIKIPANDQIFTFELL
jgi:hypothetical protein